MSENALRKWRNGLGLNLDEACALLAERNYPISPAKLSRMEREQEIPVDELRAVQGATGIPYRELRPDLAQMFGGAQ